MAAALTGRRGHSANAQNTNGRAVPVGAALLVYSSQNSSSRVLFSVLQMARHNRIVGL